MSGFFNRVSGVLRNVMENDALNYDGGQIITCNHEGTSAQAAAPYDKPTAPAVFRMIQGHAVRAVYALVSV